MNFGKNPQHDFPKMRGGGVQRPFGTFPKNSSVLEVFPFPKARIELSFTYECVWTTWALRHSPLHHLCGDRVMASQWHSGLSLWAPDAPRLTLRLLSTESESGQVMALKAISSIENLLLRFLSHTWHFSHYLGERKLQIVQITMQSERFVHIYCHS